MDSSLKINDMVVRFANVNGTGSASANNLFAKAIFRMGIPVSPKNIFPSNIQGLPTWYEVRVSEKGYLGRRDGIDITVSVNPQSMWEDIQNVESGGYFIYDNTKELPGDWRREDVHFIGIPMTRLCAEHYENPRHRQLFKNIVYVGALATLIKIDWEVLTGIIKDQFKKVEKLIPPNIKALELGRDHIQQHVAYPIHLQLESRNLTAGKIMMDGNAAIGLGAVYGGATVAAWYPITPSTSVVNAFEKFAGKLRIDSATGKRKFAIIQAEDELAAMGMVMGATWNGARAFTATSGPGVSLMSEFLGLAYFAEIPVVLVNVQRGGPSTGMPTRTQQADIISSAYASHGDTKHVLLFPADPKECFEMSIQSFDLADQLQTPIILMTDLDLGMNDHLSAALECEEEPKEYDRGKVLSAEQLDAMEVFGRYLDVDEDGICYRTLPGTHPTKGSFFTRGTSKDEMARYTEKGDAYVRNVDRLMKKWETAKDMVPRPEHYSGGVNGTMGLLYFGTSKHSVEEAIDLLAAANHHLEGLRIKAFPFNEEIKGFIDQMERVFVVEQNRDAQMRSLLINELGVAPDKLVSVLNYDGQPITADFVVKKVMASIVELV
jgi:2-oxoglutarate ferredoxin oxidoreductase subunit alpha